MSQIRTCYRVVLDADTKLAEFTKPDGEENLADAYRYARYDSRRFRLEPRRYRVEEFLLLAPTPEDVMQRGGGALR